MTAPIIIDAIDEKTIRCCYFKIRVEPKFPVGFGFRPFTSGLLVLIEMIVCYAKTEDLSTFDSPEIIQKFFDEVDDVDEVENQEIIVCSVNLPAGIFKEEKNPGAVFRMEANLLNKIAIDPNDIPNELNLEYSEKETLAFRQWEKDVVIEAATVLAENPEQGLPRKNNNFN